MSNTNTQYYQLISKRTGKIQFVAVSPNANNAELSNVVSTRMWDTNNREAQTHLTTMNILNELYILEPITRDQWIHEFAVTISEMCSAACISDFQINIK